MGILPITSVADGWPFAAAHIAGAGAPSGATNGLTAAASPLSPVHQGRGTRAPSPANASVSPLHGSLAPGGRPGAGGGGFFFFGAAEMLTLAFLVVLGALGALGVTGRPVAPQPFISLLERPG
jgi:hypothetical protein